VLRLNWLLHPQISALSKRAQLLFHLFITMLVCHIQQIELFSIHSHSNSKFFPVLYHLTLVYSPLLLFQIHLHILALKLKACFLNLLFFCNIQGFHIWRKSRDPTTELIRLSLELKTSLSKIMNPFHLGYLSLERRSQIRTQLWCQYRGK